MTQIWDAYTSERDKQVLESSGFGARAGFGKRPALLVIDVSYGFCGDRREPILESIKRWSTSCGESAWDAVPILQDLIATARRQTIPVIYTTGITRDDRWDRGSWAWKTSKNRTARAQNDLDPNIILPQIAPKPADIVVYKRKPSAFHGTDLHDFLTLLGCDSVIVVGTTTSGCVRATVVDAFSANFRVAVVADGCFDRLNCSHAISLMDMNAKYADVVDSAEAIAFLNSLPLDLFSLPGGVAQTNAVSTSGAKIR